MAGIQSISLETVAAQPQQRFQNIRPFLSPNFGWNQLNCLLRHGGSPIAGWLIRANPTKMDDLGVAQFYEKPHFIPLK